MIKFQYLGAFLGLLVALTAHADAKGEVPHQFSKNQCAICHKTAVGKNEAMDVPAVPSNVCVTCHPGTTGRISHPVDITPGIDLPPRLPLVNGRMSCLTCHVVHPTPFRGKPFRRSLLRKTGRGGPFCRACHPKNANHHALFEKAHPVSRSNTRLRLALDAHTQKCFRCHDRHLHPFGAEAGGSRAGRSEHGPAQLPVGAVLADVAAKNPKSFNPPAFLCAQMRLYDGRIGCGTCHSAYSKQKHMLVAGNHAGELCLQCHIKQAVPTYK